MIEIAKKEFFLDDINYFNLDVKEALNIISKKKKNKFDTIFIDIYDKNSLIPEFFLENNFIQNITSLLNNT
jgi:spermidine synthase